MQQPQLSLMSRTILLILALLGTTWLSAQTLTVTISPESDFICFGSTHTLTADANGGTGPYTYLWSTGETTMSINVSPETSSNFSVTVTDSVNDTAAESAIVAVSDPVEVVITVTETSCNGGIDGIMFVEASGGMPPYTYLWSIGATTAQVENVPAGAYEVTVSDALGCFFVQSIFVVEPPAIDVNVETTPVICANGTLGSITAQVAGGTAPYTYLWSNGATGPQITDLLQGTYSLTVTDANGCTETTQNIMINAADGPVIEESNTIVTDGLCIPIGEANIVLNVNAGVLPYTYNWADLSEPLTTPDRGDLEPGVYTLLVTDAVGCYTDTVFIVDGHSGITGQDGTCTNSGLSLKAIPLQEATYAWSFEGPANPTTSTEREVVVRWDEPGTYTVTLTVSSDGCMETYTKEITIVSSPVANAGSDLITCPGGSVQLQGSATPGFNVQWFSEETLDNAQILQPLASPTVTTEYVLIVSSNNEECRVMDTVKVTVIESPLNLEFTSVEPTNCQSQDGSLTAIVSGGSGDYEYTWSNGAIGATITGLQPAFYQVTVQDLQEGCLVVGGSNLLASNQLMIAPIPDVHLCPGEETTVEANVTGGTPPYAYEWFGPNGTFSTTSVVTISSPDFLSDYLLTVVDAMGCSISISFTVNVPDYTVNPSVIQPTCGNATGSIDLGLTGGANLDIAWDNGLRDVTNLSDLPGGDYCVSIDDRNGCVETLCFTLNNLTDEDCATIAGQVIHDLSEDCVAQTGEPGLSGWLVMATDGGNTYHTLTDAAGNYVLELPLGTYTLTTQPNGIYWELCQLVQSAVLTMVGEQLNIDFLAKESVPCTDLSVDLSANRLRRCFDNYYWVEVCNNGAEPALQSQVQLTLDPFVSYVSSAFTPTSTEGQLITWEIATLPAGQCISFWVEVNVSCDAVLGQTHCSEVKVIPHELCLPANQNWSGTHINLQTECNDGNVLFKVSNESDTDLGEILNYIVIEDGVIMMEGSGTLEVLQARAEEVFDFPANGSTYTFQISQVSGHPYHRVLSRSMEGCGENENGGFTVGLLNLFSQTTATPANDIFCLDNIGSYDPNDKQGYPLGFGEDSNVLPATELNYRIRFQNTGTDTAFTVVIRDEIAPEFDLSTFRQGPSSHPYTVELKSDRTLIYTFNNILLPDSTTNLEGSQGFVDFYLTPFADLPLKTKLLNSAAIYFDFNEPIITNTSLHTIDKDFLEIVSWTPTPNAPDLQWRVYPNPASEWVQVEVSEALPSGTYLKLVDPLGRVQRQTAINGQQANIQLSDLSASWYTIQLFNAKGQLLGTGRLVKK